MTCYYVTIDLDMGAHNKQNDFLSNKLNKSQFISLFGNKLFGNVCTFIPDNTETVVFLMHCFQHHKVFKRSKSGQEIVSLKNVIDVTDPFIKENIIFPDGWSGCDTTSSTYGNGKIYIFKIPKRK